MGSWLWWLAGASDLSDLSDLSEEGTLRTRQGATQLAPASEGANAPERPAGKSIRYM